MSASVKERIDWNLDRNMKGHRVYTIKWLVLCTDVQDGPEVVSAASGLPTLGSTWTYGNDNDAWAFCTPILKATPVLKSEPGIWFHVEQSFSTVPVQRCMTDSIESPLSEPPDISGDFIKYQKEGITDRLGDPIRMVDHTPVKGPNGMYDANRPQVHVGMNVLALPVGTIATMLDTVNDALMWGLAARCVKLSAAPWQRLLYGTCTYYYRVDFTFDLNEDTFDRTFPSRGPLCLQGNNPFNPDDPPLAANGGNAAVATNFEQYTDKNGHSALCYHTQFGVPETDPDNAHEFTPEFYSESNFTLLNVPDPLG